jgi:ribonuclease PH
MGAKPIQTTTGTMAERRKGSVFLSLGRYNVYCPVYEPEGLGLAQRVSQRKLPLEIVSI